jgi:hypothetical protein
MERATLSDMARVTTSGERIGYGGFQREDDDSGVGIVHLHAGSTREERVRTEGSVTFHRWEHVGGVHLALEGTTDEDKKAIARIRRICFFSGGLIFLGKYQVHGTSVLTVTGTYCKKCSAPIIDSGRCEWKTCAACVATCTHQYVRGAIHGGGLDIGVGEFCGICGIGKPEDENAPQRSLLEHHLAVERELGVNLFYRDGPFPTPRHAALFEAIVAVRMGSEGPSH